MPFGTHHRIVGLKLLTLHGTELELAADLEWKLQLWKMDDWTSNEDREIEMGSLVECSDPEFRAAGQIEPTSRTERR